MYTRPIMIGISGGTSCGKTSIAKKIAQQIQKSDLTLTIKILSQDNSYKILTSDEIEKAARSDYNFDHPNAQDHELFEEWLSDIRNSKKVEIPIYDFVTHSHSQSEPNILIDDCDVCIVEGLLLFYHQSIRELLDYKIFVDVESDERLARRIHRDTAERGRTVQSVITEWRKFAQPGFKQFIFPTKEFADIIVPRGGKNNIAIEMITTHISKVLR